MFGLKLNHVSKRGSLSSFGYSIASVNYSIAHILRSCFIDNSPVTCEITQEDIGKSTCNTPQQSTTKRETGAYFMGHMVYDSYVLVVGCHPTRKVISINKYCNMLINQQALYSKFAVRAPLIVLSYLTNDLVAKHGTTKTPRLFNVVLCGISQTQSFVLYSSVR